MRCSTLVSSMCVPFLGRFVFAIAKVAAIPGMGPLDWTSRAILPLIMQQVIRGGPLHRVPYQDSPHEFDELVFLLASRKRCQPILQRELWGGKIADPLTCCIYVSLLMSSSREDIENLERRIMTERRDSQTLRPSKAEEGQGLRCTAQARGVARIVCECSRSH